MDYKTFSAQEFVNMTPEEKKAVIHDMLTLGTQENNGVKAIIFDKANGRLIEAKDIVEKVGAEQAEEMLFDALNDAKCGAVAISKSQLYDIMEKCIAGTATEEEQEIFSMIAMSMKKGRSESQKDLTIELLMHTIFDLVHFMEGKGYAIGYNDVMNAVFVTMLGSMLNTPGGALERFKHVGPDQTMSMVQEVKKDIEKALNETIWKDAKPSPEFAILGLITYAQQFIVGDKSNKMSYVSAKTITDFFGFEHTFDEDEPKNDNCDCQCDNCTCDKSEEKDS